MRNFIRLLLIALLVGVSFQPSMAMGDFFFMENSVLDKQAPDFTLKNSEGNEVNYYEYRNGQKSIVFFWATWCPHCVRELKEMNKNPAEFEEKGIKLVIVDLGETIPIVKRYMEKNDIKLHVFIDENSQLADPYGLIGVPTFFFVNEEGIVTAIEHALPENYIELFSKK